MNLEEKEDLGYNEELERNKAGGHGVEGRAEIHWIQLELKAWREKQDFRL